MGRSLSYPWSVLDLAPTSDKAEIKRAYARKLKVTRPEDDAQGFQALLLARQSALATASALQAPTGRPLRDLRQDDSSDLPQEPADPPAQKPVKNNVPRTQRLPLALVVAEVEDRSIVVPLPDMGLALEKAMRAQSFSEVADQADVILPRLRAMSLLERGACEEELLLVALGTVAAVGRDRTGNGRGSSAIFGAKLALLRALASEFHWVEEDKRVSAIARDHDVEGFDTLVNLIRHGQPTAPLYHPPKAKSSRWSSIWLWVFMIYAVVKVLALLASL